MFKFSQDSSRAFIIAEVGINHNGDINLAKKMIELAKEVGADAVKFQTFRASEFCGDPEQLFTYQSQGNQVTESMLSMFSRFELSTDDWNAVVEHCTKIGIIFMSTPQNTTDLDLLMTHGIPAIKVGSDDLTNLPLIRNFASRGLPLILSSGMSSIGDVDSGLRAAGWPERNDISVLVCTSQYPTPPSDSNVARVRTLKTAFPNVGIGFSDHSEGVTAATMAFALGARIFEKHFTLDHNLPGPDHWFSPNPTELKEWVEAIRVAELMYGSGRVEPTAAELEMRTLARRSVVATREIIEGDLLTNENLSLMRPGNGIQPSMFAEVLGRTATRKIAKGQLLDFADFK